jgi:hypothetical protein
VVIDCHQNEASHKKPNDFHNEGVRWKRFLRVVERPEPEDDVAAAAAAAAAADEDFATFCAPSWPLTLSRSASMLLCSPSVTLSVTSS